ncbi:MAG TPA: UPF0175 family protein [Pirellulales bacterium]|nr:UPF0175 family protein [Pirellulales bacterium]
MPLNVTFDFPTDVEEKLRRDGTNFDADVKEAFLMELFRRGRISHYDLSRTLRLDRFETDAWLKRNTVQVFITTHCSKLLDKGFTGR